MERAAATFTSDGTTCAGVAAGKNIKNVTWKPMNRCGFNSVNPG